MPIKLTIKKLRRRFFYARMRQKHKQIATALAGKQSLRVVFLVSDKSVWKVDPLFRAMIDHPRFEPIILVVPYTNRSANSANTTRSGTVSHFAEKGYSVLDSWEAETQSWRPLSSLKADLLFFANPHNLTLPDYYADAFRRYLSFYVPYTLEVTTYKNHVPQYNQRFHNAMWKIYVPHQEAQDLFKQHSGRRDHNVVVSGFPAIEPLAEVNANSAQKWKPQVADKLKVIWAPHHTIQFEALPLANFLKYSELFVFLSERYKDRVQWSFKPHPMLRDNLNQHPEWGIEKTDAYYDFWAKSECSQLDEGEYAGLFTQSDAMIHDSASFMAEYLYTQKPVLFLVKSNQLSHYLNAFGRDALGASELAYERDHITQFIDRLVAGNSKPTQAPSFFLKHPFSLVSPDRKPHKVILDDLVNELLSSPTST
jgi:hypothetical protein